MARLVCMVAAMVALAGCAGGGVGPDLAAIYADHAARVGQDRNPVIVIPGILGSRLVDSTTGQMVWGAYTYGAADADYPEGARLFALPMREGARLADLKDEVEPDGVLESLDANVGVFKITALRPYQAIIRTLAAGRYVDRDLAGAAGARTAGLSPTRPRDRGPFDPAGVHYTCFQFDYDWRRDVSEQAERLDRLVRAASDAATRGRGLDRPARVDIVAHSMGGLVALYYLRFGPHPLPEDGSTPPVTWEGAALVDRVLIVGTPSAGSVLSLKQLVEGTRHAPITPTYRPAVLATMPSIYQLLPRPRQGRVVEDGSGAACDVYDAAAWERRRWGPFDPREDRTLEWLLPGSNTPADRRRIAGEHLAKCLARARQFHAALDAPAEFPPHLEVHLFVGDAEPTPDVLTVGPGGVLSVRSVAPGDGTVTRASALMDERVGGEWCPALASPIPWTSVTFIPADHVGLTEHPTFTDQALHLLLERPRRRHAGG